MATTQSAADNSTKLATTAYIDSKNVESFPTAFITGSIPFSDGSNLIEDNSNLFFDSATDQLQISSLAVTKDQDATTYIIINNDNSGTDVAHTGLSLYDGVDEKAFVRYRNNTDLLEIGRADYNEKITIGGTSFGGGHVFRFDTETVVGTGGGTVGFFNEEDADAIFEVAGGRGKTKVRNYSAGGSGSGKPGGALDIEEIGNSDVVAAVSDLPSLRIKTDNAVVANIDAAMSYTTDSNTFAVGVYAADDSYRIADNTILGTNDRLIIETNGTLNVSGTANYETLIGADDDIPNIKWVEDHASGVTFWEQDSIYLKTKNNSERLVIGTDVQEPSIKFKIHDTTTSLIHFTNTASGETAASGLRVGLDSSGDGVIISENPFRFNIGLVDAYDISATGLITSGVSNYDTLVNAGSQDFVTAKWVEDHASGVTYWNAGSGFVSPKTSTDSVNVATDEGYFVNENQLTANAITEEITVGDKHCEFADIQLALDSITDATAIKPYRLNIGTGYYEVSPSGVLATCKPYVFFDGRNAHFGDEIETVANCNGHIGYSSVDQGVGLSTNLTNFTDTTNWYADELRSTEVPGVTAEKGFINIICNQNYHEALAADDDSAAYGYRIGLGGGVLNAITNFINVNGDAGYETTGIASVAGVQFHTFNSLSGTGSGAVGWWAADDTHSASLFCNYIGAEKAIDIEGGENILTVNHINTNISSTIQPIAGEQNYISCNLWDGGLAVNSGSKVYLNLTHMTGILASTGDVVGRVGSHTFHEIATETSGIKNAINVRVASLIYIDASSGPVSINGFTNGIENQEVKVVIFDNVFGVTVTQDSGSGSEPIKTATGSSVTYAAGATPALTFIYNGSYWFSS